MKHLQMILMVACLCMLPACTSTSKETDPELYQAELAASAARGAVLTGELAHMYVYGDPKSTAVQRAAADKTLEMLRQRQAAAEKRLTDLQVQRAAFKSAITASESLPVDDGHMPESIILPPRTPE